MTLDEAFTRIRREKMFVSNLYQGTDGQWRCWLRKTTNGNPKASGIGPTALDAIMTALTPPIVETPSSPASIADQFADLLG